MMKAVITCQLPGMIRACSALIKKKKGDQVLVPLFLAGSIKWNVIIYITCLALILSYFETKNHTLESWENNLKHKDPPPSYFFNELF